MVGSVIPSSKILIEKMLDPVDWANTRLFVEYGPGVGTFTQHILDRLSPDATLLTLDTNPDFTAYLNGKFTDRSEEHTSELQSLMRISYAVFCLKTKHLYTKLLSPSYAHD